MSDNTPTRTCPTCSGTGGRNVTNYEVRGGKRIESTGQQDCRACSGSGRLPRMTARTLALGNEPEPRHDGNEDDEHDQAPDRPRPHAARGRAGAGR